MDECNFKKKDVAYTIDDVVASVYDEEPGNVSTGDDDTRRYLFYQLSLSMAKATQIDIIVSFLMESGVRMLIPNLQRALDRGCKIRILTGDYLGITQPSALYLLKSEFGDKIDLRFYADKERSFHAKSYIFHNKNNREIYIGSSNISKSALTSAIEWNYHFTDKDNAEDFQEFYNTFENLFYKHAMIIDDKRLKTYADSWHRPALYKDLIKYDAYGQNSKIIKIFRPRGAQIEALYSLQREREEGTNKALVCAATGIGKTYLAAFDSLKYKNILFIAHREEILKQAAESFRNVRESNDIGFFDGQRHDTKNSMIFASIASIGKKAYLNKNYFQESQFDYIVIDEFHHAVNDQYKMVIEYFKPEFLLGLTATPERMDGKNVYELCNYIVPYTISLQTAINRGLLVPFHYYGIYDDTVEYDKIHIVRGEYDRAELNDKLLVEQRFELIYKHYMKYVSKAAIGFCCSREHAEHMAEYFVNQGIKAAAVYSGVQSAYSMERNEAVEKIRNEELAVIFAVDMLNEGVDIPNIDMVMFLRPTESPVVFLQQLGRGLRTSYNKEYLTVLDFVGNYRKADHIPFWLSGEQYTYQAVAERRMSDYKFPIDCQVDFELRLLDIFKVLSKRGHKKQEIIREEYIRIRDKLGKVPTRMELFTAMEDDVYQLCLTANKGNPFKYYLTFLDEVEKIGFAERQILGGIAKEFLAHIETTRMTKSYKMPLLLAFYNQGDIKMSIDEEDIYISFKAFYQNGFNWKDITKNENYQEFLKWDKKQYVDEAIKMPVHYLLESGKGFFVKPENAVLALNPQLEAYIKAPAFIEQMKDIIEYRTMEYYRTRFHE